jgi:pimeloyl-ACP methyl ester carboxylesterase
MPTVNVLGIDIHVVEHGASPREAMHTAVLLHGFGGDLRFTVAEFEPPFGDRPHWRSVYLDFPGMGRTTAPPWVASTDDILTVTSAAVDALAPGRFALAGVSFGGYIAAGLAAADPDRVSGMALIVPMVLPHGQRELATHAVLVREDGVRGSEDFEQTAVIVTAETLRRWQAEIDPAMAVADEDAISRIEQRYGGSFAVEPPGGFTRPALIMTGRQDSVLGFNDQWRRYGQWPRATFAVLDRGGHLLNIELPALHDVLVRDWLDRVEAYAANH